MYLISPALLREQKTWLTHGPRSLDARKCALKDRWILLIGRVRCVITQWALESCKRRIESHRGPKACCRMVQGPQHQPCISYFLGKTVPILWGEPSQSIFLKSEARKLGEIGCIAALTFFFLESGWTQDLRVGVRCQRPNHFILFLQWGKKSQTTLGPK